MSDRAPRNVSLSIGGRNHVISVGADEEPHLRMLAGMIDERVSKLGVGQGQTEARMLLVTALMLADELHTLQGKPPVAAAPAPAPAPATAPAVAAPVPVIAEIAPEVVARVAVLADRVEKLAARLEHWPQTP
ncbi:cell division protein ZapA [Novosphingobium sp.]|uniref:cell division protein ZapA n=1 Tax=Novosphingobium sp. TaxID=1874826 RepID=UPI003B52165F